MFKVHYSGIRKQLKWSRRSAHTHAHTHTHTTKHTLVPALLTWQRSWFFIKIQYSEPNISAPTSVSQLERDWSTKPIVYIINNSLAFRYVTSKIWKYYGIFGFVKNERGSIHEHKAPFRKHFNAQAFKVYSFVSLCERRGQNQYMVHCLVGFVFMCTTLVAGSYQTALHYCRRPPSGLGWIACIRRKASCTEPRCPYVIVRYEYM